MFMRSEQGPTRTWNANVVLRTPVAFLLCGALWANFILVSGHDKQRLLELALLILAGMLVLGSRSAMTDRPFGGTAGKPLSGFFALGIVSSALAASPRYALVEVSIFFLLYVLARVAARDIARHGSQSLRTVLQVLASICAMYGFVFAIVFLSSLSFGQPLDPSDFTTGFGNIRFFSHVQTSTLPLLILLCCLTPRTARIGWLWLAVAAYWWMALFATMGRGTLVGMVAACVVIAVLLRRTALPYLKQAASTAALGVLSYFFLLVLVPALAGVEGMRSFSFAVERTAADPASGRLVLWERAGDLIAQHPFLGVGPMHFAHNAGDLHTGAHPHDWLMQIGSEWGIPALLCLIVALGLALLALWHAGKRIAPGDAVNRTIFAAMLATAVAILVDGLVSGLFVMPQSQLGIALYLACVMGWYRTIVSDDAAQVPGGALRAGMALALVAALCAIAAIWPEALARFYGVPLTALQEALNTGYHWPRLWEAGFF